MITASKAEVGTFYPFTLKVGFKNIKNILESCSKCEANNCFVPWKTYPLSLLDLQNKKHIVK